MFNIETYSKKLPDLGIITKEGLFKLLKKSEIQTSSFKMFCIAMCFVCLDEDNQDYTVRQDGIIWAKNLFQFLTNGEKKTLDINDSLYIKLDQELSYIDSMKEAKERREHIWH